MIFIKQKEKDTTEVKESASYPLLAIFYFFSFSFGLKFMLNFFFCFLLSKFLILLFLTTEKKINEANKASFSDILMSFHVTEM